jgi:tetratricopeptide (TPR) repeat protein
VDYFDIMRLTKQQARSTLTKIFFQTMTTLQSKTLLIAAIVYAQMATAQSGSEGMTNMQLENWDKAIAAYSAQAKASPADQTALLNLGNAYLAKGDKAKAKESFDAAFSAKPDGAYADIANVRNLLLQDKTNDAEAQIERAAKHGKKDVNALRLIGESFLYYIPPGANKRPNLTKAETLLKNALELNGKDFATLMALGYCYKEMPNGGLAAQHYEYAENIEPKNPLPKLMLAKVYRAAKIPEKFIQNINNAISVAPAFGLALREKASYYYFAKKWEDATNGYKELVNKGDDVTIEDQMQLANCYFITGDCKNCSDLVEKILQKDGTKNYLRRLQGYCDYNNGNFQHGLTTLRDYFKVVSKDKIISNDYYFLAKLILSTKGDTLDAINNYKKYMEMDSSWKQWKEIGDLYYTRKDNCSAAKAYQTYLDSVPKQELGDVFKLGLAQYYCKDDTNRYVKALKSFSKITELKPDASVGWFWSGKAAKWQDPDIEAHPELSYQFGKAETYFEKYIDISKGWTPDVAKKNANDIIYAYGYIIVYYGLNKGDNAKVIEIADKMLAIDPANKTALDLKDQAQKNQLVPAVPPPPTPGGSIPPPPPAPGGKGGKN